MATKTEDGKTNSHILTEDVITLREAADVVPGRVHFATIWRWHLRGLAGQKLETYKIGSRLVTSKQAVHRFLDAVQ